MDYTKDTLSMGNVRMYDGKYAMQGMSGEQLTRNQDQREDCKHEMGLLGGNQQVNHQVGDKELNFIGTDSLVHAGFGVDSNMMVDNVYKTRTESVKFMRSYMCGEENKISRNVNEAGKQRSFDRDMFYSHDNRHGTENMDIGDGVCLDRVRTIDDMRQLNSLGLEKEGKITVAGESYESVVSDFLPPTPQVKDQQHLEAPLERRLLYNEIAHTKTFQYQGTLQEENSGYATQQSHFTGMNIPRCQRYVDTKQAQSTLYHDRERMESEAAAAMLASLQDSDVVAVVGTEHNRIREDVSQNEALEPYSGLAGDGASCQNRNINDKVYLSKSNKLSNLNLDISYDQIPEANLNEQPDVKDRQDFYLFIEDGDKPKAADISNESHMNENLVLTGETDRFKGLDVLTNSNSESKSDSEDTEEDESNISKDDEKDVDVAAISNRLSASGDKNLEVEEDELSVQSLSSPVLSPAGTRRFKCSVCKHSFKFRKGLNKHMKTHKDVKIFICSVCNSSFDNRISLKKHLRIHSDAKTFTCQQCSTQCSSLRELKHHQSTHKCNRKLSCTECSYKAKHKKGLIKHMAIHSSTKVYKCQVCKFSSTRSYSLQRHMKTTHSKTFIHKCSKCSFNTSSDDKFVAHIAMHLSERTTICIICAESIKKKANLTEHLMNHYTENSSTCISCDETFSEGFEYMLHLLEHKELTSNGNIEAKQTSESDHTSVLENGNIDSAPTFGFLALKSKIIMTTPMMEEQLTQISTVSSRLAEMTKVVSLLNEKSKVISQLTEISTLAAELSTISGNVLQSYKNTYGMTGSASSAVNKSPAVSNDSADDSSFADDDFEVSSVSNVPATKIKDEILDSVFTSADAGMQIQVDFNGDPVSCVQKEESFKKRSLSKSKEEKELKCSRCHLTFTDTRSLKRHFMAHDNVRPYSCDKCGQSFRRNEHLKKHMVTHSDARPFVCKDCPYAAKTEHRLKIHVLCHSQTKAFACQHCTYTARTNYELNHHMKRHEPRSCSQCDFICYSRTEMKKHVFTHSSFDCNECEFTTSDRAEYNKHMKRHSVVQHLCCELCGYSCDTMKKFKYHKLRHENKTPYQCSDCDYKCSSRASYDCHRLKHAGLKPYLCSFCGAAFRKTSHLNQHLLIHKDEKSFKCGECGYACRTKHNLKEHEMTHSGEKPFTCKFCSFSCRRNKALQLHMLKHESMPMMLKHENTSMMISQLQMPTLQFSHLQMPLHMPMIPTRP